jgi:septal ring factor EnvC (AmiA/AmiB activator)
MQDLNKYDRNLLDTISQDELKLKNESEFLQTENEILETLLIERQEESEKAKKQAEARKVFLDEIRSEKGKWEISMNEYINAQAELNKMIEELIAEMSKPKVDEKSNFAEKKGKLPWAVNGKIIADFGKITHPEYKTTIVNNGISIEAAGGTPVKSVAAGIVEFVGRMRGYGKLMIINHFGGFLTIYAHLDENFFEKGARIKEGQAIGSVGESGSLDGNKLHFEIRHENNALNPLDWLKKL